jgi:hypothetical protein
VGSQLVVVLGFVFLVVEKDNKPPDSLSFFTFFSLIVEDDDELGGSSLSLGFFLKCRR